MLVIILYKRRVDRSGICSSILINKRENQDVVEAFLAEHPGWRLVPVKEVFEQQGIHFEPGQLERFEGYMQLLPHVNNTDGFFAAVLQRDE